MLDSVVREVFVHLVRHHDQIAFDGELGECSQLLVVEDHTCRVVRAVHQQNPSAIGDRRPQFVGIEPVVGRTKRDGAGDTPGHCDTGLVRVVHRFEQNNFVAGFEQSEQAGRQSLRGTSGDQNLGVGIVGESPETRLVLSDGLT